MPLRALLINPPARFTLRGNNPAVVDEHRGVVPPLGLMYLAAYVRQFTHHEPAILDCPAEQIDYDALGGAIVARRPDVVGITTMTFTLLDVVETVRAARNAAPDAKVVLGGPHVHLFPDETIRLPGVDYLVQGEGEVSFARLLDAIEADQRPYAIPGVVWRDGDRVVNNGMPELIDDLDGLPFPARDLTPLERYSSLLASRRGVTTMLTSRGCPYRCAFCMRSHLGKRFRARSPRNVVDEIEQCVAMGIGEFLFYDDTFNLDRSRVVAICEQILSRGLDIGWDFRGRVDCVDLGMLQLAKRAGCQRVYFGVESGVQAHLDALDKGLDLGQVREGFSLAKQAGIATLAYFMIGLPGETRDDVLSTIEFARELEPDFAHITILTPFPGTPIYLGGLASGAIKRDYWREFAANPTREFVPPFWPGPLPPDELRELCTLAYKRFYVRPRYIARELLKVRSLGELGRKLRAGLAVLRMR